MRAGKRSLLGCLGCLGAAGGLVVAGLGVLWAAVFLLCAPIRTTDRALASPDGRHLIRFTLINPGATSGYFTDVELEGLDGSRTLLVDGTYASPVVRWTGPDEITIEHANRDTIPPRVRPPGVRVLYKNLSEDVYYRGSD